MKRNLKHYRQIASTVLITTLLMAPSLSPLTSLADNPDDGVMYEDIIEDADEGIMMRKIRLFIAGQRGWPVIRILM